jgi:ABC-type branched-subunit amino acid transport system substrate-binding protein
MRSIRTVALVGAIVMILGACGQKPGVHETAATQITTGTGTDGTGTGSVDTGTTGGSTGTGSGTSTDGGTSTGGGGTSTGGGGGGGTGTGGGTSPSGPAVPSGPQDKTGVTAKEITIGIHAPVTGAAPFPAAAFSRGRDVYWKWSGAPKVNGRTVKVLFENDDYNPTTARDRCRKMAEQQKAFLLVGGGGTDQIQACAQYAAGKGIPYLSPGVTEIGVNTLPNYFALSMSYKQQAELLWQLISSDSRLKANAGKVAMVRTDTPNFDDAHQGFLAAANKRGKKLVLDRTLPKNPSQTDYNQMAQALSQAGAQIVHILVAPTHYVLLTARLANNYRPWWIGGGITKGLNAVLETGCTTSQNAIDKGLFFSPFPGIDKINSLDPNYIKAYREVTGEEPDDLGIALWGLNKTLHQMLLAAGPSPSRQSFIAGGTSNKEFKTNVFPPVRYTPQNHFGSSQVHLLKANCSKEQYVTEKTFVSKF